MIRLLVMGLVACGTTLGGAHLGKSYSALPPNVEGQGGVSHVTLEVFETELLAANRLSGNRVTGYFLARFAVALNPGARDGRTAPIDAVFVDTFHHLVAAKPMFDFTEVGAIDVAQISSELRRVVNSRVGRNAIHSVLVTQVDYLKQNEVRTNSAARRATIRGEATGTAGSGVVKRAKH